MKKILFLGYGLLVNVLLQGQSITSIQSAYEQSARQVVLLVNKRNFIPIKTLDRLHPVLISGQEKSAVFQSLNNYISCPLRSIKTLESQTWNSESNLFIIQLDLSVIPVCELTSLSATINKPGIPYIVLYEHGQAASLPPALFDQAVAILYSWGYSDYLPVHQAQIIFGAEGAVGTLPFFVNNDFRTGSGLLTRALGRLKYGPPELVGLEGRSLADALQYDVEDAIKNKVFPGANLLVAKDGVVIYHEAFGRPTYDSETKVSRDNLYDLASITKILGATLGSMYLYNEGKFNPDLTVGTYLPKFRKSNKSALVWKDIMTHRAGLPASITFYKNILDADGTYLKRTIKANPSSRFSIQVTDHLYANKNIPRKIIQVIKKVPLLPRKEYVYSDLSMILLYKTIEQITRLPFSDFMNQNIYAPMGADHTRYLPLKKFTIDQVIPTEQDSFFRHTLVRGYVHDENAALLGGISGHAGLFSDANDMAKLAQMLLNKGSYGGIQYLKPETINRFTAYQYPELNNRRGLGFDKPLISYDLTASAVARDASSASYGHSGFTGTFIWIDPQYNLIYILLTNRVNPSRTNNKISQYSIRPCIQQTIYDHILIH